MQTSAHEARSKIARPLPIVSGGDLEEATPDPIPNSEVKLLGADGTAREALWESRTPPGLFSRHPLHAFACGGFAFLSSGIGPDRSVVDFHASDGASPSRVYAARR